MTAADPPALGAALLRAGSVIVPVKWKVPFDVESGAPMKEWQKRTYTAADIATVFAKPITGVGVHLGPSGLADVDLDVVEAVRAAAMLLPATAVFGRPSNPDSHYVYRVAHPLDTVKFQVPALPELKFSTMKKSATLVELRCEGVQTVWPGSLWIDDHDPSHVEVISWRGHQEPTAVDGSELRRAVEEIAAAALLARCWPEPGARHDFSLALAGWLLRVGVSELAARRLIEAAAGAAADEEWQARAANVVTTARRLRNGQRAKGGRQLADFVPAVVFDRVRDWLHLKDRPWLRVASATQPLTSDHVQPIGSLLNALEAFVQRYVILAPHATVAVVLWVAHAHALDAFDVTPYLNVNSPERRCGKTLLLELLELVTPRAWHAIQPTEAVLFRRIEGDCPTLLLDEVDTLLKERSDRGEAVRGLLNAGNRRGATVPRCVGRNFDLKDFSVFCAKVLAGIRNLPDTVADRAIPIRMVRRTRGESVARFRRRHVEPEAATLRAALESWGATAVERLRGREAEVPEVLHDRAADAWEPLFAIADEAGGDWPRRAREAAPALHADGDEAGDDAIGAQTLAAIRDAFDESGSQEAMFTTELLAALVHRDDGPWAAWWGDDVAGGELRGKGPAYKLARLLKPYAIASVDIRRGPQHGKGFRRDAFIEAWARYLPNSPSHNGTTGQRRPDAGLGVLGKRDTPVGVALSEDEKPLTAQGLSRCPVSRSANGAGAADGLADDVEPEITISDVMSMFPGARVIHDTDERLTPARELFPTVRT